MNPAPITVICGLIQNQQGAYFIARRAGHKSHAGYWEFPGGKLEPGETHEACLKRELREELDMTVTVGPKAGAIHHAFESFAMHLIAYYCKITAASYQLNDHDDYLWLPLKQLSAYRLTPPDRELLQQLLDDGVQPF